MNRYEWYGQVFRAWSKMPCAKARVLGFRDIKPEDHQPHTWNSDLVAFGPYFCEGHNPTIPYQPKHRRDV